MNINSKITKQLFTLLSFFTLTLCVVSCKKTDEPEKMVETGTVSDIDGNVYTTVKIGDKWWMAENLRVSVYNDSTRLVKVTSTQTDSIWANQEVGAYCEIDTRYGLHYNWFAVSNYLKNIAPAGWHVPSDEEWKQLEKDLGMSGEDADKTSWRGTNQTEKLVPVSSTGWPSNQTVFGTNESGFNALPGGCRVFNGKIGELSQTAYWWTSSAKTTNNVWYRHISISHPTVFRYYLDKHYGLSIRCVKD